MKKILLFTFALLLSNVGFAQVEDALVYFADKENVAEALANPISILSQEALDRKNLHGVTIDERDVPLNETYKATIAAQTGITVYAKSKWMNAVYVRGQKSAIDALDNLGFVTEIDFMNKDFNRPFRARTPKDKFEMERPRNTEYDYGSARNQIEMIDLDAVHDEDYIGTGITVAFMDNGYPNVLTNRGFAKMRNENRLLGYYDFVDRVENPDGTGSHGAHTLSDAAGFLDGEFIGTGFGASYYLFITEDGRQESPLEEAYWVEALERADSLGVFVTNTSLGYRDFDNSSYDYQYSDLDGETTIGARGANHAYDKGMLNVVSAGNEGWGFGYITSPADAPGALTIGAVDGNGNRAYFSSHGPTVDGRVKPDVMAQGEGAAIINRYGDVDYANGTSFSGPIMAGAVAALWEAAPHLTNGELMQIIRESAHLYNNPTDLMGYGIPNFSEALAAVKQLGTEDYLLQTQFAIYPNPVTTTINISFPKDIASAQFALYDVLGKQIINKTVHASRNQVNVSDLKSGLYIATLKTENKTTSFKIIKQ